MLMITTAAAPTDPPISSFRPSPPTPSAASPSLLSRTSLYVALFLPYVYLPPSRLLFTPVFQQWLDTNPPDPRSLSPQNNSDFSSAGGSPPMGHLTASNLPPIAPAQSSDDEVIPTAIVIKNIPFNVKRETLLELIVCPISVSLLPIV